MIVSRQNQKIKDIRRLRRCKGDAAILEGPHLIREALKAGIDLEFALATPNFLASPPGTEWTAAGKLPLSTVEPRLFEELCESDSPRGILALATLPRGGLESTELVPRGVYIFVDGVQDPGNLGALARAAEAFGVVSLCTTVETAHPNHPRAMRASAGSLLRIPVSVGCLADDLDRHLKPLSPTWVALTPTGGIPVRELELSGAAILAVGAEGPGLSERVLDLADLHLTIPLAPEVESLNSAVAAAIALYELDGRPKL